MNLNAAYAYFMTCRRQNEFVADLNRAIEHGASDYSATAGYTKSAINRVAQMLADVIATMQGVRVVFKMLE